MFDNVLYDRYIRVCFENVSQEYGEFAYSLCYFRLGYSDKGAT